MRTIRRRRREGKTNYKARISLLKSGLPRVSLRRSNRYFIAQYIKSKEARDSVIVGVNSKELLKYGWEKEKTGNLKSKIAAYLTGFLLGKKILDKDETSQVIFDIGLRRSIAKSRTYAFLKGLKETGVKISVNGEMFPKIKSEQINVDVIKKTIEQKFI